MSKIVGKALPDMPWQDKDENDKLPVWRYKANPIIDRFATRNSNSIFNSAVVPFEDGYAGIFRCDSTSASFQLPYRCAIPSPGVDFCLIVVMGGKTDTRYCCKSIIFS